MVANSCYFIIVIVGGGGGRGCVCVHFLGFAGVRLFIACAFVGTVNYLGMEFSFWYLL